MIAVIWITTLLLLGAWTLFAWALSTLLRGDAAWIDTLQRWLFDAPWREALDGWLPGWSMTLQALLDALQTLLVWLGAAAPWLVWLAWGLGALPLLGLGALLHVIVVLVRRDRAADNPGAGAAR
ncbi:MAG: DUF4349 domain-containing protein [Burkholderiales bacterium]|nr:DUF4349 domain-containing protein [Burkholderiales bacterium]